MRITKVNWMVKVAMLSAVSVLLMLLEFPIPFIAPPFYEFDFSEVPVLIGAFALGPIAGVTIEFIKILLNLLINGTITGGVGEFANFLVGVSFILPVEFVYMRKKTKKNAIIGMIVGGIIMVSIACVINAFILIPAYGKALGIPIEAFVGMGAKIYPSIDSLWKLVILCTLPFNLLKVIIVSVITTFTYKHIKSIFRI